MDDGEIVDLYWRRDESAIRETESKYGSYLTTIAYNVLADLEDSKESVNDTYLGAWDSMPPQKPKILSSYLAKLTRRISIDIFRKRKADKRRASEYALSLAELDDCASDWGNPESTLELQALANAIESFLQTQSPEVRSIFMCRYYFMDSIREICSYYGMSEAKVKNILYRSRKGLKESLKQEVSFDE